jgi:hypothetical protein
VPRTCTCSDTSATYVADATHPCVCATSRSQSRLQDCRNCVLIGNFSVFNFAERTCTCSDTLATYTDDATGCSISTKTTTPITPLPHLAIVPGVPKVLTDQCLSPRTLCFAGRTCTCSDTSATYIDDTTGCSIGTGTTTPITYSAASGGTASVPGVTEVQVAAGTFDAGAGAIPPAIDITRTAGLDPLMVSMMRARFEVVAVAGKVVTISSTQQPKKPLQVKGGGGGWWRGGGGAHGFACVCVPGGDFFWGGVRRVDVGVGWRGSAMGVVRGGGREP